MTKEDAIKKLERYEDQLCLLATRGSMDFISVRELEDQKQLRREIVELMTRGLE